MARKPQPGGDRNAWGLVMNEFLDTAHNPDGTIKPVKGTPFDFTTAKSIGKDLEAAGGKPIGFDHHGRELWH